MGFWNIVKEDFLEPKKQDPAFNSILEIFFNYPGVWAIINHRFANFFYIKGFRKLARLMAGISRFLTGVDLHPAAKVGRRVFLDHATGIVIGETAVIGDRVLLYQGVTLGGVSLDKGKRHPTLEDDVVIGAGAKILGNITIGQNSKIGANSVVVKSVPNNCTAVGIPAKILGSCDKTPLSHDKIPDINKELFAYLIKRLQVLENVVAKDKDFMQKDDELDKFYESYLKSLNR